MFLSLDCTNGNLTFSLFDKEKVYAYVHHVNFKQIAEHLAPMINDALQENNFSAFDIKEIISVAGPGGFSGVRVGTSFLEGVVAITQAKIHTISSLSALALSVPLTEQDSIILSVINAKRGAVYIAAYDMNYKLLIPEQICNVKNVPKLLETLPNKFYHIAGHGYEPIKDYIKPSHILSITASTDALLFGRNFNKVHNYETHLPIYLREADAVIAKKKFDFL